MGVVSLYREIFKNHKFHFMIFVLNMLSSKEKNEHILQWLTFVNIHIIY